MECDEIKGTVEMAYDRDEEKESVVKDEAKTADPSGETADEVKTMECDETNREVEITYERDEEKEYAVDNETNMAEPGGETGDEVKMMKCYELKGKTIDELSYEHTNSVNSSQ